ncbi:MAG TPA: glycosyltransferase [Candidatus Saccharimonadales bacterium]|nr:glycosyltransferase [Candidatus Saccharimonadales bacterium]
MEAEANIDLGFLPDELEDEPRQDLMGIVSGMATRSAAEASPRSIEAAYQTTYDEKTGEVIITSDVTEADYEAITPAEDMAALRRYAEQMKGQKVIFINATAAGGGVAIMRKPQVHLMQTLGIDAHWYALRPDEKAFQITKGKFHNVLQNVAAPGTILTEDDEQYYEGWIADNATMLHEPLSTASHIICDDWQPSGLIPYIKGYDQTLPDGTTKHHEGLNPNATLLFRDHIQTEGELMETPGTPQHKTWEYIWEHNRVKEADAFVTHPVDNFVPPNVPDQKVVYMPATIDPLDDLNRPLNTAERQAGIGFINRQLELNEAQQPLDLSRPYFILMARFDPSKGMDLGIKAYVKARNQLVADGVPIQKIPQFLLIGNGSIDDPDGPTVLEQVMTQRSQLDEATQQDLKVARVPHNDMAINAVIGGAMLALQPSTKEGFESRVTDAQWQGVQVIGSAEGGIPLQIIEGQNGYVISPYDTDAWASRMVERTKALADPKALQAERQRVRQLTRTESYKFTTVPNTLRWLGLCMHAKDPDFAGNRRYPEEFITAA